MPNFTLQQQEYILIIFKQKIIITTFQSMRKTTFSDILFSFLE